MPIKKALLKMRASVNAEKPVSAIVFFIEFLYPAGSVERLLLASVKWMRSGRNLHTNHRICFAIFPDDGFTGSHGRTGEKLEVAGRICENNFVVRRMDICFHDL
jgi:hypothetical protein